jgi:hypothetical protein
MSLQPPFHFAIPLCPSLPSNLQSTLFSLLQSSNFSIKLKTNDLSKNQVLFLKIEDSECILREAENLKIAKKKISKKSNSPLFLENLPRDKYFYFLKSREELDPKLKELELHSSFTYEERRKFIDHKEGESEEEERKKLLSLFSEQEILMIAHSLLMKVIIF